MIDPVALRSLVALDQHGTVAATAAALGYTPSAVSQQLKRLEAGTGVPLLERLGRGVVLTAHGRRLVESAAELLAGIEQLETELQAAAGRSAGLVRLGAFSTAVRGIVAPALAGDPTDPTDPLPDVRITEIEPWDGVERVADGRLDLALVHNWEPVPLVLPANLEAEDLGFDTADVVVRADDPVAGSRSLRAQQIADRSFITVGPGSICHQWLTWMLGSVGAVPRFAHTSAEFASHLALVAAGRGTALVPRLGRGELPPGVVAVPLADPVPLRRVTLLWRRTMTDRPGIGRVRGALRTVAAQVLEAAPEVSRPDRR